MRNRVLPLLSASSLHTCQFHSLSEAIVIFKGFFCFLVTHCLSPLVLLFHLSVQLFFLKFSFIPIIVLLWMSFILIEERGVKEVVCAWGLGNAPYASLKKLLCFSNAALHLLFWHSCCLQILNFPGFQSEPASFPCSVLLPVCVPKIAWCPWQIAHKSQAEGSKWTLDISLPGRFLWKEVRHCWPWGFLLSNPPGGGQGWGPRVFFALSRPDLQINKGNRGFEPGQFLNLL